MYSRRLFITWIPYKMNTTALTIKKANEIANVAKAAASVYSNNKELINGVASAVKSTVQSMTRSGRGKSSNTSIPIVINKTTNRRRGANTNRNAPVAIGSSSVSPRRNNNYRLRNIERIAEVTDSNIHSIQINPGMESSFPWLSNIARSYDRYRFHRLIFRYKPTCPTDTVGQVIMAWDYDSLDPIPNTEQDLCQETYWLAVSSWKPGSFSVSLRNNNQALYTRKGMIGYADLKTYDLGQLIYKGSGQNGYIEVDYDITLIDRQPDFISNTIRTNSMVYIASSVASVFTLTANQDYLLPDSSIQLSAYNIPYEFLPIVTDYNVVTGTGSVGLKIPAGIYKINWTGASILNSLTLMEALWDPTEGLNGSYVLKKSSPYNQTLVSPAKGGFSILVVEHDTVMALLVNTASQGTWATAAFTFFLEAA